MTHVGFARLWHRIVVAIDDDVEVGRCYTHLSQQQQQQQQQQQYYSYTYNDKQINNLQHRPTSDDRICRWRHTLAMPTTPDCTQQSHRLNNHINDEIVTKIAIEQRTSSVLDDLSAQIRRLDRAQILLIRLSKHNQYQYQYQSHNNKQSKAKQSKYTLPLHASL
jgi:hypothetical protein